MDLMASRIPAALVTAATNGYATPTVQRNWIARHLFSVPIPDPAAGKPRHFPLLAVYDAALLSWAAQRGILSLVRGAWLHRVLNEMPDGGLLNFDVDIPRLARSGALEEFLTLQRNSDLYWAILIEPVDLPEGQVVADVLVGNWGELGNRVFLNDRREGALFINVSALVRNVNGRLAEAGHPVRGVGAIAPDTGGINRHLSDTTPGEGGDDSE